MLTLAQQQYKALLDREEERITHSYVRHEQKDLGKRNTNDTGRWFGNKEMAGLLKTPALETNSSILRMITEPS